MAETPVVATEAADDADADADADEFDGFDETDAPTLDDVDDASEDLEADADHDVTDVDDADDEHEPDVDTVDLSEDDMADSGSDGLFTGVEDAEDDDDSDAGASGGDTDADGDSDDSPASAADDALGAMGGGSGEIETAINEGFGQLATLGLTDADFDDSDLTREQLRGQVEDVASTFRVGYFGAACAEKYVLGPAEGDVSPAWGLLGSVLVMAAVMVMMRPDGDALVEQARSTVGGITGGASA